MSEIINLTIVCDNCQHHNKFKVSGRIIPTYGGDGIPLIDPEEENKERICEECGSDLK